MSENLHDCGFADRVHVNETYEVRCWTHNSNCSAEQSRTVVAKAGVMAG